MCPLAPPPARTPLDKHVSVEGLGELSNALSWPSGWSGWLPRQRTSINGTNSLTLSTRASTIVEMRQVWHDRFKFYKRDLCSSRKAVSWIRTTQAWKRCLQCSERLSWSHKLVCILICTVQLLWSRDTPPQNTPSRARIPDGLSLRNLRRRLEPKTLDPYMYA